MKKIVIALCFILLSFGLFACSNKETSSSKIEPSSSSVVSSSVPSISSSSISTEVPSFSSETPSSSSVIPSSSSVIPSSSSVIPSSSSETPSSTQVLPEKEKANIYLAGDSTVKTYTENTFIGGWGQFLQGFLDKDYVQVINCSEGGRSSRSFINEGRLFTSSATTEFNVTSIESQIKEGDYLFIQFAHNDDDSKKESSYGTMYDRMVPLGTPDSNGIYPVTPGTKVSTTSLPKEYTDNVSNTASALSTIARYGDTYYSYDCGGTYKWFLKQYIDFAKAKGVTPILLTPVARVKFAADGTLQSGAGLHGENFAYVEAVRQLAQEEDCLLIDLFAQTKTLLETATPSYANYLMALKPNDLVGVWPADYDMIFGNTKLGYTGIEGTHYNKYGAYLTAALAMKEVLKTADKFGFSASILKDGYYVEPSNSIPKTIVSKLEALTETITTTNPERVYGSVETVISKITNLASLEVTFANYEDINAAIKETYQAYFGLNIDDRPNVTNFAEIANKEAEVAKVIADNSKPATSSEEIRFDDLAVGEFTENTVMSTTGAAPQILGNSSKSYKITTGAASAVINNETVTVAQYLDLRGSGSVEYRALSFTTTGPCKVTVIAKSSSKTDARVLKVTNGTEEKTIAAPTTATAGSAELTGSGTYKIFSAGSGIYVYYVLIEYFD